MKFNIILDISDYSSFMLSGRMITRRENQNIHYHCVLYEQKKKKWKFYQSMLLIEYENCVIERKILRSSIFISIKTT